MGPGIFTDEDGAPLTPSKLLKRCYGPLLARAGLPRLPFHSLRHAHATMLLASGTHPRVVQARLGHATIAITLDTYSHILPGMGRAAADSIDAQLEPRRQKV
jgi:integrase